MFVSPADLQLITERISRAFQSTQTATGSGYRTAYVAQGTDFTTQFFAEGVKSPDQLKDDFLNLFIWVWSLKDYLKVRCESVGLSSQLVEDEANQCPALTYVADIANRAKHGTLNTSRSGMFAELVDVGITVPQKSIQQIEFAGPQVTLRVRDHQHIVIRASVVTRDGVRRDALAVLDEAMRCWETKILARLPT